jgi:hypothetical protein
MLVLFYLVSILILPFKSKCRLEAENVALRHQVMVLRRQVGGRVHLTNLDRLFLVQLYHWFPSIRRVLAIVRPETVVRWHRAGFRCYWRWKSRSRGGRPQISGVSLPQIKSARTDGAVHQAQAALRCARHAGCPSKWVHPCPTIDACAPRCNTPCNI